MNCAGKVFAPSDTSTILVQYGQVYFLCILFLWLAIL